MKATIHPTWNNDAVVTCACGSTFTTGSTLKAIQVDICSACHPFFTGEMKFVDTQGRVDKFMQKMQKAQAKQAQQAAKKKPAAMTAEEAKSYKQLLQEQQQSLKKSKPAVQA
jgi:large subunit ribosomal protein L31